MSWTEGRITVVGNPGLDTLVLLREHEPDLRADGHFVRNVDTIGHAAAFGARGMARLGHRVRLLGSVGDDAIGRIVESVLADDGVDTSLLFTDPTGTARSVNFVFPDGRRTFFYDGGAHMTLQPPEDLVDEALSGADLVLASLPNWARGLLPRARAAGIPVAVDLQDVRAVDDPYRADFVAHADHLFASAAHLADPVAAAQAWFAAGPARTVVFGMGPRGALLVERDAPDRPVQPPPELDLPIVDTTGCGDSLACGFLDGLLFGGLAGPDALRRGQLLARIVASGLGSAAAFDRARLDAAGLP
jgi:sugar/nucleoside kinase (ribokinase family)